MLENEEETLSLCLWQRKQQIKREKTERVLVLVMMEMKNSDLL